jgi:hypothetical protein
MAFMAEHRLREFAALCATEVAANPGGFSTAVHDGMHLDHTLFHCVENSEWKALGQGA